MREPVDAGILKQRSNEKRAVLPSRFRGRGRHGYPGVHMTEYKGVASGILDGVELEVRCFPDPVLKKPAEPVEEFDEELGTPENPNPGSRRCGNPRS